MKVFWCKNRDEKKIKFTDEKDCLWPNAQEVGHIVIKKKAYERYLNSFRNFGWQVENEVSHG